MSSLRKQPTLSTQQTFGSLKWMLDELQDSADGEGPFGSVSLDDLFQGPLEREPRPSQDQAGTADGLPPALPNASAPGPDLRGRSVEEVWQAIHHSPSSTPTQNAGVNGPIQQQGMYSRSAQLHAVSHASSIHHSHEDHAGMAAGPFPRDPQLLHANEQQYLPPQGHAFDPLSHQSHHQRLHHASPLSHSPAPGQPVSSQRTGASAGCAALSMPDAEAAAQPMEALQWPGSIPSAPLSAALPGSTPLVWPGLRSSMTSPAQLPTSRSAQQPASMPAALSASVPAKWAARGGLISVPAESPACLPGFPRSTQPQPSVEQHPKHNASMPMLPPLQVPHRTANGSSRARADPAAWLTGAGAQSQPTAASHGRRVKASHQRAPQESQPETQANPAAKVFRPMTPSSPEAQQPDWPQSTEMPAAKAARQRKRKGSSEEPGDERQTKRMVKNRESAARSRMRKQAYTVDLESQVEDLRRENKDLLEKVIKACPPPDPKHMPVVDGEALRRTRTTPM